MPGGKGHEHTFASSGWCLHCNYRDDGKLIGPGGDIWHEGRSWTPNELQEHRERVRHG